MNQQDNQTSIDPCAGQLPDIDNSNFPIVVAILGAKGAGKTALANGMGFPQYQFNQLAIERLCDYHGVLESTFKDAAYKDELTSEFHVDLPPTTPRQLLIDSIEDALATNSDEYIADNFEHFTTWLAAQDNYVVTLPSIRREFEVDYLTRLVGQGYSILIIDLEREGCEYAPEGGEVTEQHLLPQIKQALIAAMEEVRPKCTFYFSQQVGGVTLGNKLDIFKRNLALSGITAVGKFIQDLEGKSGMHPVEDALMGMLAAIANLPEGEYAGVVTGRMSGAEASEFHNFPRDKSAD